MNNLTKRVFLPFIFCALIFLTGCVRYEVGVNFHHQQGGEITQHITLGQRLTALSETEANNWLNSIEERARLLDGSAKRLSSQEMLVTIPFSNGEDLSKKFNQFFNPNATDKDPVTSSNNLEILQLQSDLQVRQTNLLFLERNKLNLQVDLRGLGILSNSGNIVVSPGSLVNIDFALTTPWGGKIIANEIDGESSKVGNGLVWHLKPGEINQLSAVFWTPSYLGIGTGIIILSAIFFYFVKYKQIPGAPIRQ
ncbi:MAG: hypothetical protein N5P05_000568 [Chroococcopsis gigantea SAG 12.99]|jgi:hypothetical protein|nr:DUF3153 domain-containing protein [Chlorogloea purpurea SAG 13.99]MDV2998962.1 hypothetical protein [Chroococcopsis gigantea SAG 12.99]